MVYIFKCASIRILWELMHLQTKRKYVITLY